MDEETTPTKWLATCKLDNVRRILPRQEVAQLVQALAQIDDMHLAHSRIFKDGRNRL